MDRKASPPPDIASLAERVRTLGWEILESRQAIEGLKAPFTPDRQWIVPVRPYRDAGGDRPAA